MEPKERIIEIIEKSGLTPSEFADKIGVQRSAISHITSGRNNPSLDFLIKIKNEFPEIDTDWLIFGIEKEDQKTDEESETEIQKENLFEKTTVPQPTLFDESEFEKPEISKNEDSPVYKGQKSNPDHFEIKRVIIFYEDGSFEDYFKRE